MIGAGSSASRIGILFALPEESAPFARRVRSVPALSQVCRIGCSGSGALKAARQAAAMIEPGDLWCMIICGYAGGLTESAAPGELVLAESVLNGSGGRYRPDPDLFASAVEMHRSGVYTGVVVTETRVIAEPSDKRALAARYAAAAVDTETAAAAVVSEAREVPWLAVRAITDGVTDSMPFDFSALVDGEGEVDRNRVVTATLIHPWKIPAIIRLGVRSARAGRNLAGFLEDLLPRLLDRIDELSRP